MNDTSKRPAWDDRYRTGDLPWDTGRHDRHLEAVVSTTPIGPGSALEIGCGTGTNAIWLSQQGFTVTAIDISCVAIEQARAKAAQANAAIAFHHANIIDDTIPNGPFSFVLDRGCFHSLDGHEARASMATIVADHLQADGLWFSLVGSADGPPRDIGPPRLSAHDVVSVVEPTLEILELRSAHFDSQHAEPPRCWLCLMRKRLT